MARQSSEAEHWLVKQLKALDLEWLGRFEDLEELLERAWRDDVVVRREDLALVPEEKKGKWYFRSDEVEAWIFRDSSAVFATQDQWHATDPELRNQPLGVQLRPKRPFRREEGPTQGLLPGDTILGRRRS